MSPVVQPPQSEVRRVIEMALAEDLGMAGDITGRAVFDPGHAMRAEVVSRGHGVVSGVAIAGAVFATVDTSISYTAHVDDGATVAPGTVIATVAGSAQTIVAAERTALNLLGRLSGIATLTWRYVDAVAGHGARITDTRKTTPGLRSLEKFAVRCGGGANHRMGLFDAVMIKDNHIAAAGGVTAALERVVGAVGHTVSIEVEVDTLDQLQELLGSGLRIDTVLLDNMDPSQLRSAVAMTDGAVTLEASGGIDLETVAAVAATGVDVISVGALTHSAVNFDVGLDIR